MKKGICCAGNMIVDITYPIETWPRQNELTISPRAFKDPPAAPSATPSRTWPGWTRTRTPLR